MSKKASPTSSGGGVQVFELTMDNTEDQDELNRRLRKPGEPDPGSPLKTGRTVQSKAKSESSEKKRRTRKGKS